MGPGMFDDLWKGLLVIAVLLVLFGYGCGEVVRWASDNYRVRVEKVEPARASGEGGK